MFGIFERRRLKMNIETLLDVEIESEFEKLSAMKPGTDEYRVTVDGLTKLMDRKIELLKTEVNCDDRTATREGELKLKKQQMIDELELKKQQMEEDKKDRLIKNILGAAGVVLPLLVTIWGTKVSLKFEEEGTFTTIMGRGFVQKLLPKK
jgi:hypothetical protein